MRKLNFSKEKCEKIFRNIISNALIVAIIFSFVLFSFKKSENNDLLSVSNSEYRGTIYAGDKNSGNVSLMINVYWGTEYVEQMLEILKSYDIKTTFYIGGLWAETNPAILKKIYDAGHEIGNHGYSHKEHGKLSYEVNAEEISKCHNIVKEILGIEMNLFAPPGGSYSSHTTSAASNLGYKTIMWTRDTIDWRDHNSSLIYNRAVTDMKAGDLILMHPTKETTQALKQIIEFAQGHSLKITPVSAVIS